MNAKDIRTAQRHISLQHRHFALIAAALHESKPLTCDGLRQWQSTVNSFIVLLRGSNPRFDQERFLSACNHD